MNVNNGVIEVDAVVVETADKDVQKDTQALVEQVAGVEAPAALSEDEQKALKASEEAIETAEGSWLVIAQALKAIDDQKLYRAKHKNFNGYCRDRWDYGSKYAYRLIAGYVCYGVLEKEFKPKGEGLPSNESLIRPLVPLGANKWVEAWQQVLDKTDGQKITADVVKSVVKELSPKDDKPKKTRKTKSSPRKKLKEITELVAKALDANSEQTVDRFKQVLVEIQGKLVKKA